MLIKIVFMLALCTLSLTKDDDSWVWNDNNRDRTSGRNYRDERYEVYEGERPFRPSQIYNERPEFSPIQRPGGVYGGTNLNHQIQRPGGVYGGANLNHYGQGPSNNPEILTGPIPSWVKEGPFKNFDKCKCTEKFNCNTPGISYGHCDVSKQYCCYSTNRNDQIGGPLPSRPIHSIDNGILVGPGGPNHRPRPGGFGVNNGRPISSNRPIHSIDNGILVGPGGPFDRPYNGGGGYGRLTN